MVRLTSASSCAIWAEDVDGGRAGRSFTTSVGVIIHARTLPKFGSIGGRAGDSRLFQGTSPRAAAASARACHCAGVPAAAPIPSVPARATSTAATALPSASPAAMSLAVARPPRSAASRCSAALRVISSTAAGKRSLSISVETPDSTASSDG